MAIVTPLAHICKIASTGEINSNKFIYQKLNYIHQHPIVDGLVEKPEDYMYSIARNYADLDAVLDVVVIPHKPVFMN